MRKKKIIFVDDEPLILEGLENLLRPKRRQWEMSFVVGGKAALEKLSSEKFDVIVSDMRMPEMDGAKLLSIVQDKYPDVVRIVLSGYSELEAALRAVPVAHQFLTKPCDSDLLENVVERASNLSSLIGDELVRKLVGKIDRLPSIPRVYSELTAALADERATAKSIARILEQDMAMCAKILQLVNSAFFRTGNRMTSVESAVSYLGLRMVKNLTLSVEVFDSKHAGSVDLGGFSIDEVQRHSVLAATIAARIVPEPSMREDAFMAAVLHDLGKLILALELPQLSREIRDEAAQRSVPVHVVEQERTGVTHAEVGGYLLGLWGLPYPVVEAVSNHHCPHRVQQQKFDILTAVYLANHFARKSGGLEDFQLEYATRFSSQSQLDAWARQFSGGIQ